MLACSFAAHACSSASMLALHPSTSAPSAPRASPERSPPGARSIEPEPLAPPHHPFPCVPCMRPCTILFPYTPSPCSLPLSVLPRLAAAPSPLHPLSAPLARGTNRFLQRGIKEVSSSAGLGCASRGAVCVCAEGGGQGREGGEQTEGGAKGGENWRYCLGLRFAGFVAWRAPERGKEGQPARGEDGGEGLLCRQAHTSTGEPAVNEARVARTAASTRACSASSRSCCTTSRPKE